MPIEKWRRGNKRVKRNNRRPGYCNDVDKFKKKNVQNALDRTHVLITPQMIREAVKKLQTRKVYVDSKLIGEYIRRCYPIEKDAKAFQEELQKKLNSAVVAGLITMHGEDKYCLPTLRQEACALENAINAFWESYKKRNGLRNPRKKNTVRSSKYKGKCEDNADSLVDSESTSNEDLSV